MLNKELVKVIASRNLTNYGVYQASLESMILEVNNPKNLVLALNNVDTDGVSLKLLETHEAYFYSGAKYLKEAIGAENIILNIPEYRKEIIPRIENNAALNGVSIEVGIVNRRSHKNDLICHIVTSIELGLALANEKVDGVYVCVNNKEFKKVPSNTTLRSLVGNVKGVRTGNIIRNAKELDLTVQEANISNGVINSIFDNTCVVSLVQEKLLADRRQSCGKCVFCREGLLQLEAMANDITIGRGKAEYYDLTSEIGEAMVYSTPCSMGQESSILPLSAIKAFPDEFDAHIKKKKCPADFCKAFRKIYVDPTSCIGCGKCMEVCETNSIDGASGYIHIVFDNTCTKCEKCIGACPKAAIHVTTDSVPRLPFKMMRVGRFKAN